MPLSYRGGGAENMLWTFLRHVDRERILPAVAFPRPGSFVDEVAATGLRTFIVPPGTRRPVVVTAVARIAHLLRRQRPDVVLSWLPEQHIHVSLAAGIARAKVRVMWWQHDLVVPTLGERLVTLLPTHGVGASSFAIATRQSRLRPARSPMVVHPGIDAPRVLSTAETAELRAQLGIPTGDPVVGVVGRLIRWKGQHQVLETIARLRQGGRRVHGLFVGGNAHNLDPGYEAELLRRVAELGLNEHVTFTGQVATGTDHMQLMDVVVSASQEEPFGIVFLEAMALGIPMVGVSAAGPLEIVGASGAAKLVPSAVPDEFVGAIATILDNPATASDMGRAGRKRYAEGFTAGHMTAGIVDAVQRVSGRAL